MPISDKSRAISDKTTPASENASAATSKAKQEELGWLCIFLIASTTVFALRTLHGFEIFDLMVLVVMVASGVGLAKALFEALNAAITDLRLLRESLLLNYQAPPEIAKDVNMLHHEIRLLQQDMLQSMRQLGLDAIKKPAETGDQRDRGGDQC